jgi:hypothetical protein
MQSIITNGAVGNGGGGGKHLSNKKSIINDEKIMKVASVYAMGSLSPVLSKHQAVQQQYQKLRDLSQGSLNSNNNRNSHVSISLSNVKLPYLINKIGGPQ